MSTNIPPNAYASTVAELRVFTVNMIIRHMQHYKQAVMLSGNAYRLVFEPAQVEHMKSEGYFFCFADNADLVTIVHTSMWSL